MSDNMIKLPEILAHVEQLSKDQGYIKNIGIEYIEGEPGKVVGRLKITEKTMNPFGGVHGGCIFGMADTIAGAAAMTRGSYVTTLSSNIDYLSAPKNTEYIYATAREIKDGRTISVYEVYITDDAGKNIAKASLTYYKLGPIAIEKE